MNRRLRSTLPLLPPTLEDVVQPRLAKNRERLQKEKQAANYNTRRRVCHLPDLQVRDKVWISDLIMVHTLQGQNRRNRWFLVPAPFAGEGVRFEGDYVNESFFCVRNDVLPRSVPPASVDGTSQLNVVKGGGGENAEQKDG
ncbi:hypothetical protein PR048_023854 [Dryococelus australis]|uniref:Uncharacterized protein n=1 Tax=Dryococelus australis TaxID=614101 RepID=A0ABQ9GVD0_9NEOP|nr:hypothetical protein PR048_023854 [Dryococelus australis]